MLKKTATIIGILLMACLFAAIVIPVIIEHTPAAKLARAKKDIDWLQVFLLDFQSDTGRFPSTEEGLSALVDSPPGLPNWRGPYLISGTSIVDPWGHPYAYVSPDEKHEESKLSSAGPDEIDGTADDIKAPKKWLSPYSAMP